MLGSVRDRIGAWSMQLLVVALVLISPLLIFLYFGQHSMVYHPRPYTPGYARAAAFDGLEISYTIPAGPQTAYFIPSRRAPPRRVWLAFCGNGSLALDLTSLFRPYPRDDEAFLLVDYPGYGRNAGSANVANTRESAEAALRALAGAVGFDERSMPLGVIGHSLGAAAAFDFAAHHSVEKIVAVAPFTTLREEAARMVGPLSCLLTDNYDNRAALHKIFMNNPNEAVAIFHGTADGDIPETMGENLSREFPRIRFFPVTGADHVTVLDLAKERIVRWMADGQ